MKLKIVFVFGTRPEAVKLFPLIREFKNHRSYEIIVINTGQQKGLLDQTLLSLELKVEYNLSVMEHNQSLSSLSSKLLIELDNRFKLIDPDYVFIHGDTTSSMIAGLVARYNGSKIIHIESGLRSNNILSPWPEEMNRKINSITADYHMAPTKKAENNLISEGVPIHRILVTGNTGIDTLKMVLNKSINIVTDSNLIELYYKTNLILVTIHRRENFRKLEEIFYAIKYLAESRPNFTFLFPVHLNPNVRTVALDYLNGIDNLKLIEPLNYVDFVSLLDKCYFVITDSGGIQEEAAYLGKPIILCRDTTERPEAVDSNIIISGTSNDSIIDNANKLFDNDLFYKKSSVPSDAFGDGNASTRIIKWFSNTVSTIEGAK
jgi:UDP-N-acetylglucosamine 2-epimerase (non-hydrolysing)